MQCQPETTPYFEADVTAADASGAFSVTFKMNDYPYIGARSAGRLKQRLLITYMRAHYDVTHDCVSVDASAPTVVVFSCAGVAQTFLFDAFVRVLLQRVCAAGVVCFCSKYFVVAVVSS